MPYDYTYSIKIRREDLELCIDWYNLSEFCYADHYKKNDIIIISFATNEYIHWHFTGASYRMVYTELL